MLLVGKDLASYTLAAGEPFVLEVQLLDSAGRGIDLDDQAMVLTFYTAGTRALVTDFAGAPSQYEGERLSDTTGEYFRWAFDGRWSDAMLNKPGLRVELAQRLFYGRRIISTGTLSVVSSAAIVPSLPGGSIALTAVRVTIKDNAVIGGAPVITQTVILYDGPSVPVAAPVFTTPTSVASDGTPQVGELLTGIDGVATNAASYTRRWLLGSTVLTSSATYTPTEVGSYRYETIAIGPGGETISGSNITVAAATPAPSPTTAIASLTGTSVYAGDSITNYTGASSQAKGWTSLNSTALGLTRTNSGINGTFMQNNADNAGSARANNFRDTYTTRALGTAKRDNIFVGYGYNDARYSGAPATINLAGYIIDYRETLSGLVMGGYDARKIVIVSPYYVSDAGLTVTTGGITGTNSRASFEQHVAAAASLAAEFGTIYCDTYAYMRDHGGSALIGNDDVHPNDTGHQVISDAVVYTSVYGTSKLPLANVNGTSTGANQLQVAWTAGTSVTNYTVQIELGASLLFGDEKTVTSASASWTGITAGSYRARVRANYTDGTTGPWAFLSNAVTVADAVVTPPSGALARDATGGAQNTTASTSQTWNHVVGSGANLGIVTLEYSPYRDSANGTLPSATTVTVGGQTATLVSRVTAEGQLSRQKTVEIWKISNPTAGTVAVIANFPVPSGAGQTGVFALCGSVTFLNAHATNPVGTPAAVASTSSAGDASLSVSTTNTNANGLIVAAACARSTSQITFSATTATVHAGIISPNLAGISVTKAGGSGTTTTANITTADQLALIAVPINSAA